MNVASVSFGKLPPLYSNDIKVDYTKPNGGIPEDVPDNAVVAYGSQDSNYRFPIYAVQVREQAARYAEISSSQRASRAYKHQETPEEYQARKLYSTEWCM